MYGLVKQKKIVLIDIEKEEIIKQIQIEQAISKMIIIDDYFVINTLEQNLYYYDLELEQQYQLDSKEYPNIINFTGLDNNMIIVQQFDRKQLTIVEIDRTTNEVECIDRINKEKKMFNYFYMKSSNLLITTTFMPNRLKIIDLKKKKIMNL